MPEQAGTITRSVPRCLEHEDCGAADIASETGRAVHRFEVARPVHFAEDGVNSDDIPF